MRINIQENRIQVSKTDLKIRDMSLSILRYFGLAGTLVVLLSSGIAAFLYRGSRGERFSVLNHFVSELGELGISRGARLFNAGLILGGLLLTPFLIGLGSAINSWLGWLGMLAGVGAALSLAGVGLYPMNDLERHSLAAMLYFRFGLGMIGLYGLAFLFPTANRQVVPSFAILISFLAAGCYTSFLFLSRSKNEPQDPRVPSDPDSGPERPRLWTLAIVEWLVFSSSVLWMFGIAFSV
jgi:hypothetical membrane protein